jgi:hypothetical protein
MVHLRIVTLWLGLIACGEGLFSLMLGAVFRGDPLMDSMASDALSLSAALIPAGLLGVALWVAFSLATAHRRAAAEAALQPAGNTVA